LRTGGLERGSGTEKTQLGCPRDEKSPSKSKQKKSGKEKVETKTRAYLRKKKRPLASELWGRTLQANKERGGKTSQ